jgi:ABC-type branched-subunit amino acid transport system ATPase component
MAVAPPLTLVGGGRPDPIYNRIANHVHSAVGQFDAVNPTMDHANVLAIVNGDGCAGFTDLIQVLTGNAFCESGEVIPMFREYSEGRIREEKLRVHLYLWFNNWKPSSPQKFFPEVHAAHHAALCHWFSVNAAGLKRLPV